MIGEEISVIYSVANGTVCPEWAYIVVVCIFALVIAVCLAFCVAYLCVDIRNKHLEYKKHKNEQTEEYFEGYIKGADDRKNNTVPSVPTSRKHDYLQGYIAGHRDDKFWK